MIKLDLHTHSIMSSDGSITKKQYKDVLEQKVLDCIAITDHNRIDFAKKMHDEFPEQIIIGEEIKSSDGDVIGLYLTEPVSPFQSFAETINAIKKQQGLVLIPHPFSTGRDGIGEGLIRAHEKDIDLIESFNPRNFVHSNNTKAEEVAKKFGLTSVANSDSHCAGELGKTYTEIDILPTRDTLIKQCNNATMAQFYTSAWHLLCPKKNKLLKALSIQ